MYSNLTIFPHPTTQVLLSWLFAADIVPTFLLVGLSLYINATSARDVFRRAHLRTPWHRPLSFRINRLILFSKILSW